ncbi:MAG: N-methyl-L-tryptophan oxidase [Planctomycetaceae bacterium]|jgi:sarcosine oxidase|nr:N-methyl-L-tryptophan oxidase [Planctomycetaceae bacterium]MBT6156972.1 N-methyl-L-tryptophan oxidase [Planctomycetaceae bacterium]MBT6484459.1 N-methyl-L-tryptophan oxidase [Planctomycetaceae bacterium]MBT6494896.1 N-methyl-L-tryptophan oxidase [Planctomycetaceae bacterium]
MTKTYDCIVLGVGGFGSAALAHLARRGVRALGIERFDLDHEQGSSHGETRIIRKAYFEHPDYVPLLFRAYDLWQELEQESEKELLNLCGLMIAGPPDGEAVPGAKLAAQRYGIDIEEPTLAEARARFPGFRFDDAHAVLVEPDAGFLHVEASRQAHVETALAHGATIQANEAVLEWQPTANGVQLRTNRGKYDAASLIVTAGAWAGRLLADLSIPLEVVRKPILWHGVSGNEYDVTNGAPGFYFETTAHAFYGFPSLDGKTIKACEHTGGAVVDDPSQLDREIHPSDIEPVANFIRQSMPGVQPAPARHSMCMYTHTPDHHFIVDRHPQWPQVVIGAGFSGHGFKFTSVLGEALADLAVDGKTELPIGFLSLGREALVK